MKFLPLVSVFSFAGVALASEGVHLINCNGGSSYVTYWADDSQAQAGHSPTDSCTMTYGTGWQPWERGISCTFGGGTTWKSTIASGASGYPPYQYAGSGSNGFRNFNCYRDNGHSIENGCASIYYCV